jgi:hypothetical protein
MLTYLSVYIFQLYNADFSAASTGLSQDNKIRLGPEAAALERRKQYLILR